MQAGPVAAIVGDQGSTRATWRTTSKLGQAASPWHAAQQQERPMTSTNKRRSPIARSLTAAAAGLAALALAAAGCGDSSDGQQAAGYGAPSPSATASGQAPAAGGSARRIRRTRKLQPRQDPRRRQGPNAVPVRGRQGTASTCDGACASAWPPLTTAGQPIAGSGVSASKLGTTERSDGTTEVTYNGHPLYTFAGDSVPGLATGQGSDGFGAKWYVLSAAGNAIETGELSAPVEN